MARKVPIMNYSALLFVPNVIGKPNISCAASLIGTRRCGIFFAGSGLIVMAGDSWKYRVSPVVIVKLITLYNIIMILAVYSPSG